MVTSVQRATLIPGGFESLVYTTLSGSIGVLLPFASNEVKNKRNVWNDDEKLVVYNSDNKWRKFLFIYVWSHIEIFW